MAIVNNNVIRIAPVWRYNGADEQVNVWHFRVTSVPATVGLLHDDIDEMLEDLYGNTLASTVDELDHARTEIFNMSTQAPEAWMGANSALNGTDASDPLPSGVAALVYGRTTVSRIIGKKYLPTFGESQTSGGVWDSTTQTRLDDMAARWALGFTGANGTVFESGVWSVGLNQLVALLSTQSSTTPAYMRRRKLGRGA